MKYRRLLANNEMAFGNSLLDYVEDTVGSPDAIAQAIKTRMYLFLGEWWLNITDGLPLWQQILGKRITDKSKVDQLLIDRIKGLLLPNGTNAITSVSNLQSSFNSETRTYSFSCIVDTVYGELYITNADQEGI